MTLKRQLERFFFICSVFITPLAIYLHLMNDGYNLEKPHHVSLILLALLSVYIIHNCQYKKKCSFWKTIKFYLITYKRIKNWYATIIIISLILIPYFVVRYTHDVPEFTLKYLIYIALFICAIIYPFTFFSTQFHKIWHETNTLFNNIKFYYSKTSNDK